MLPPLPPECPGLALLMGPWQVHTAAVALLLAYLLSPCPCQGWGRLWYCWLLLVLWLQLCGRLREMLLG